MDKASRIRPRTASKNAARFSETSPRWARRACPPRLASAEATAAERASVEGALHIAQAEPKPAADAAKDGGREPRRLQDAAGDRARGQAQPEAGPVDPSHRRLRFRDDDTAQPHGVRDVWRCASACWSTWSTWTSRRRSSARSSRCRSSSRPVGGYTGQAHPQGIVAVVRGAEAAGTTAVMREQRAAGLRGRREGGEASPHLPALHHLRPQVG